MEVEPSSEARLRHQLDVQSKQINRVLSHHRIPAAVTGGVVKPKVVSFDVQSQLTAGIEKFRSLRDDLMIALGVGNVSFFQSGGRWQLQVSRVDDAPVPLLKLMDSIHPLPSQTAAIGMADGGQPVLLRFSNSKTSHVLIAGDANAGKTSLLRTVGVGLALGSRQCDLQIQVMDPMGRGQDGERKASTSLLPLAYLPHMLSDPALDIESCGDLFRFLAEEMAYRRRERVHTPRIVVLLDHVLSFLEKAEPTGQSDLAQLLQYGAEAGIHLVMAADRPDSRLIDSTMKASLSLRLVGRIDNDITAKRVSGISMDDVPQRYGEGDFLAIAGEDVTYFQAAQISDYDLHLKLYELSKSTRPRLLARPYSSRPRVVKKTSNRTASRSFTMQDGGIALEDDSSEFMDQD